MEFRYNAAGQRIEKKVGESVQRYIRDASGNPMAIYEGDSLSEQSIYGSSRLGIQVASSQQGYRQLGGKKYELSNHLGNVLAVVTDNIHLDQDSTWAQVSSLTDYYPFGLAMEGRGYQDTSLYRYGFNGMERDDEWKGDGRSYDFGARIYDPKVGRWLSVDPMLDLREWVSPYNFVQNNPILRIDPDGMLDEFNYNIETREFEFVSNKGGSERQYVNVINNDGEILAQGSVPGNKVHAYKLRDGVAITNYDANFDDRAYNKKSGYEYTKNEFVHRNKIRGAENVISRALDIAERKGEAGSLTYPEDENRYGYTVMRLRMFMSAIDQSFDALPSFTSGNVPSKIVGTSFKGTGHIGSSPLKGSEGVSALTGSTGWNRFLQAHKGVYTGTGWQKRAAADYYKSGFYKQK